MLRAPSERREAPRALLSANVRGFQNHRINISTPSLAYKLTHALFLAWRIVLDCVFASGLREASCAKRRELCQWPTEKVSEPKSSHVLKPSQVKSSQVQSSEVKSSQLKPSQAKSTQVTSQVQSSEVKSSQLKSTQVKST